MSLKRSKIISDYDKLIVNSLKFSHEGKYNHATKYLSLAARVMYLYNLQLTDDNAENVIQLLTDTYEIKAYTSNQNMVMFYDSFGRDARGLTSIYINGLIKENFDLVYITDIKNQGILKSSMLYQSLLENNIRIEYLTSKRSTDRIEELVDLIKGYKVKSILVHTTPWDLEILVACGVCGVHLKKYLINITDHAYWLGKNIFDYIIEFRSYGANISIQERRIRKEKIVLLPYYPVRIKEEFQGFPFELDKKRLIFSGGALYKISGSKKYFEIVKYILNNYDDTIFLYIGNGDNCEIINFIKEHNYDNRFYYLKERKDLEEIMVRCYFYLSTYPLIGGLMTQYAAINKKYPITLRDTDDFCNDVKGLFINPHDSVKAYTTIEEIFDQIDEVMNSKEYLRKQEELWYEAVPTESQFNRGLKGLLNDDCTGFNIGEIDIKQESFCEKYLESFNNNIYTYGKEYLKSWSLSITFKFPIETMAGIIFGIRMIFKRMCSRS